MAAVAFLLGLALVIPVFSEGARERNLGIVINLIIAVFTTIGLDIGFSEFGLNFESILPNLDPLTGLLSDHLLRTTLFSVAGIVLLYIGTKKLSRIE